jgi:hypothetical protein
MIRSVVLKEMSMGDFKMIPGPDPIDNVNTYKNLPDIQQSLNKKNISKNLLNAPEKYKEQLSWRLKTYPGCTIHALIAPSDFAIRKIIFSSFLNRSDGRQRSLDITQKIDELIKKITENSIDNQNTQNFINTLKEYSKKISDDSQGVIIYTGSHINFPGQGIDAPTAFNMLHQIFDGFNLNDNYDKLQKLKTYCFSQLTRREPSNNPFAVGGADNYPSDKVVAAINTRKKSIFNFLKKQEILNFNINEFFESTAMSKTTNPDDIAVNLMILATGWLNPDDGTIMKDNKTNPGLAGSSDPRDIVKRCLAPRLKKNQGLIDFLAKEGFADLLIDAVSFFWDTFRGKIILTWSDY